MRTWYMSSSGASPTPAFVLMATLEWTRRSPPPWKRRAKLRLRF